MTFPRYPAYKDSGVKWLGEVPEHWSVQPLRSLAANGPSTFIDGDWIESPYITDEGIRLIQTGNVGIGIYREQGFRFISEETFADLSCTEVKPNNVLICRLAAPVGRACLAPDLGYRMITSVDVCILKSKPDVSERFVVYFASSAPYLAYLESQCRGGTRDRVSRSFLGTVSIVLPSHEEQECIATFLDHETSKIDALIAEQQNLIALLKEKRQAVISHAVTKGLDPDVPMKDSGVEWLGEVPEHWRVLPLRRVIARVEQGWSPECENRQADEGEWGVLKAGCVNGGFFNQDENKVLPEGSITKPELEIASGDLLMSRASGSPKLIGSAALIGETRPRLLLSDKIFRLHIISGVSKRFLAWVLGSMPMRRQIESAISGADGLASNLPQAVLRSFTAVFPASDEQARICAFLEEEVERVDALVEEAEDAIGLLQERRSALISAAVTGKIDVRGLVPQEAA